jgi:hypothetical protein
MTDAKHRKQIIQEARQAFQEQVNAWMPKPRVLKIGDRVILSGGHPHAGKAGAVVRFETNELFPGLGARPVVKMDEGREVYVSQADEWRKA